MQGDPKPPQLLFQAANKPTPAGRFEGLRPEPTSQPGRPCAERSAPAPGGVPRSPPSEEGVELADCIKKYF